MVSFEECSTLKPSLLFARYLNKKTGIYLHDFGVTIILLLYCGHANYLSVLVRRYRYLLEHCRTWHLVYSSAMQTLKCGSGQGSERLKTLQFLRVISHVLYLAYKAVFYTAVSAVHTAVVEQILRLYAISKLGQDDLSQHHHQQHAKYHCTKPASSHLCTEALSCTQGHGLPSSSASLHAPVWHEQPCRKSLAPLGAPSKWTDSLRYLKLGGKGPPMHHLRDDSDNPAVRVRRWHADSQGIGHGLTPQDTSVDRSSTHALTELNDRVETAPRQRQSCHLRNGRRMRLTLGT